MLLLGGRLTDMWAYYSVPETFLAKSNYKTLLKKWKKNQANVELNGIKLAAKNIRKILGEQNQTKPKINNSYNKGLSRKANSISRTDKYYF